MSKANKNNFLNDESLEKASGGDGVIIYDKAKGRYTIYDYDYNSVTGKISNWTAMNDDENDTPITDEETARGFADALGLGADLPILKI